MKFVARNHDNKQYNDIEIQSLVSYNISYCNMLYINNYNNSLITYS